VGCRGGLRLQLRFGQNGAGQQLGLVLWQIVVEASEIRGGCQALGRLKLVVGWQCFAGTIERGCGCASNRMDKNICKPQDSTCVRTPEHIKFPAELLDYLLRINKSNINQTPEVSEA